MNRFCPFIVIATLRGTNWNPSNLFPCIILQSMVVLAWVLTKQVHCESSSNLIGSSLGLIPSKVLILGRQDGRLGLFSISVCPLTFSCIVATSQESSRSFLFNWCTLITDLPWKQNKETFQPFQLLLIWLPQSDFLCWHHSTIIACWFCLYQDRCCNAHSKQILLSQHSALYPSVCLGKFDTLHGRSEACW